MENMLVCCKDESIKEYYCLGCTGVFHSSCLDGKEGVTILSGHKIYCSENCKSLEPLEEINSLRNQIELRNKIEAEKDAKLLEMQKQINDLQKESRNKDLRKTGQQIAAETRDEMKNIFEKLQSAVEITEQFAEPMQEAVLKEKIEKQDLRLSPEQNEHEGVCIRDDTNEKAKKKILIYGDSSAGLLANTMAYYLDTSMFEVKVAVILGCTESIFSFMVDSVGTITREDHVIFCVNIHDSESFDISTLASLSTLSKYVNLTICVASKLAELTKINDYIYNFNGINDGRIRLICNISSAFGRAYKYNVFHFCKTFLKCVLKVESAPSSDFPGSESSVSISSLNLFPDPYDRISSSPDQNDIAHFAEIEFELREIKRKQEEAQAEDRARREQEEADRLAAIAAAQPQEIEQITTDRPDSSAQAVEERPVHGEHQPRPMTLPADKSRTPQASPRSQTLSRAEEKVKRKDRSRSKSPFRSFRWKRTSKSSGTHSDDEGVSGISATSQEPGSVGDEEGFEGTLVRKHEWENTTTKSTNRSWDKVYCVLRGTQLSFYKDNKTAKTTPDQRFKGEAPLALPKAVANVAQDYKKKKHVFRLKLESGGEFLFQAHDDSEMNTWISNINTHADTDSSGPSRSHTLPASAQKEDSKRRSFFTLKKT